jgi:hypothetical protein
LTPALLRQVERLAASFPVELAELRASDKQLRFQRAFLERRDPDGRRCDVFAALGGNRSGKSICAGWLCFAKFLRDHARSGDWFWCVGQTLDRSVGGQQKELWQALPRWMFSACGQDQTWGEKIGFGMHRKIVLPTSDGGRCLVEFRSADQNPSTFEQAKLTGVWCDERLPEDIYDRLLPRIVDRDGFILYSDIPEQWWQLERLVHAQPGAGVYFEHFKMTDNEANLPPGSIEKVSARMTADERRQRIAGEFVVMEGLVYKEYVDEAHAVDPFVIPPDWPRWRLIDYGGSAPTACCWVTIGPNECAYAYREHYERNLSVFENARRIHLASGAEVEEITHDGGEGASWIELRAEGGEAYRDTLIDPHAFDRSPANEVTIADQYERCGIVCSPWPYVNVMGEHALVQRVKYRLEHHQLKVFKTCTNLRREFRSWKYKCDDEGRPVAADAFEHDNNHLLDGLKGFFGTDPCFQQGTTKVIIAGQQPGRRRRRVE